MQFSASKEGDKVTLEHLRFLLNLEECFSMLGPEEVGLLYHLSQMQVLTWLKG